MQEKLKELIGYFKINEAEKKAKAQLLEDSQKTKKVKKGIEALDDKVVHLILDIGSKIINDKMIKKATHA